MTTPLRFAPLVRVSTESQERQGESLRTQRQQITQYVQALGGVIPDRCWDYSGQEHATPGQERAKLDKLLADAGKGLFDAVIVCDASRWSRDNGKSKAGLEVLRQHGIRFFVGPMEYDLHAPEHTLFLGMATEINEFHARQQSLKSLQNRIERARRGLPSCGKLPFGRTFNRKKQIWGLDAEKVKEIQWAADQYLNGRGLPEIANALGINAPNLWKTLNHRAGDTWEQRFQSKELNIDETVTVTIPRLLPQETIDAIHERARGNKTYCHGEIKHRYLLARMVFCSECCYAMFGQTNHGNRRYYRHPRNRANPCDHSLWVGAEELEEAVLTHLFSMFGDVAAMEQAITRAIPDTTKVAALRDQKDGLDAKLTAVQREKTNLIRAIAKGTLTDTEAGATMAELRERETMISSEVDKIALQLDNLPDPKQIKRRASLVQNVIRDIYSDLGHLPKMEYEKKRALVQRAFAGKDSEGKRLGVYVKKTEEGWTYSIRGLLMEPREGMLPMGADEANELIEFTENSKFAWH